MEMSTRSVSDIELFADKLDPQEAAAIYEEHGCLVVRGLTKKYIPEMYRDIMACVQTAYDNLHLATKNSVGWGTPDGCLFIPAPASFARDKQIMTVSCSYKRSAAFFRSAWDDVTCDIAEAILGPNVELFIDGQVLVKEPVGGHPKMLHQDASYFEHRFQGPMAVLNYCVDTTLHNGALHVVPGSHKLGVLTHIDTESHLGLDLKEWPWESALPIEGEAGDGIFFHVKTIHGSKPNWSDAPRPVFINRYRAADDYVVVSAATTAGRAEAEKAREQARKENQEGHMVRGFRAWDAGRK